MQLFDELKVVFIATITGVTICILFEWDTKENATKFFASEETIKTQKGAGVVGKPMIVYADKIEDFKV